MLHHWAFDSAAFRSLKPGPRALLWELIRRYNGGNNGRIGFSQRAMSSAINIADRETVAGYVRDLEARGFIKAQWRGEFNVKASDRRASEWALTMFPIGDQLATKDFMRWRPEKNDGTEKPAREGGKPVLEGPGGTLSSSNGQEFPSALNHSPAHTGTENPPTYTSLAIGRAHPLH